jgi:hypothetical protein
MNIRMDLHDSSNFKGRALHSGKYCLKSKYRDEAVCCREPGEAGVAEGVAAEQEAGDLVPVQTKYILTHAALQHLHIFT